MRCRCQNRLYLTFTSMIMRCFFSQVLSAFEDISLQSIFDRIKEKHNLQTVKKVSVCVMLFSLSSPKSFMNSNIDCRALLLFFRNYSEMLCLGTCLAFSLFISPAASLK